MVQLSQTKRPINQNHNSNVKCHVNIQHNESSRTNKPEIIFCLKDKSRGFFLPNARNT
jgi:hypothetical protein